VDEKTTFKKTNVIKNISKEKIAEAIKDESTVLANQKLKKWYCDFITLFREKYSTLTDEEKLSMNNTNNFLNPCQIEVFWMKNPSLQLIIQSNLPDRNDMGIYVHGPFTTKEFLDKVEPILQEPRWMKEIDDSFTVNLGSNHVYTYAERLASNIFQFIEYSKFLLFNPFKISGNAQGSGLNDKVWIQTYGGNIGESNYVDQVEQLINSFKSTAKQKLLEQKGKSIEEVEKEKQLAQKRRQEMTQQDTVEEKWDGYGVHFFPPVVIGKKSTPSVSQLLRGNNPLVTKGKAFDIKMDDHTIIVNKDGFIFVESKQKEEAIQILNVIMALGVLENFKLFAVREQDLTYGKYNKDDLTITEQQWHSQTIRAPLHDYNRSSDHFLGYQVLEISEEHLRDIINNVLKIKDNEKLTENLRLFAEAFTHLENSEYAQSFIMSWSVIERNYSNLWKIILDAKDFDNDRYSKLTNPGQWSFDYVIEALNLIGKIGDQEYDFLMELKRKRNKLYHSGKVVSHQDAERCLNFIRSLLQNEIKPN